LSIFGLPLANPSHFNFTIQTFQNIMSQQHNASESPSARGTGTNDLPEVDLVVESASFWGKKLLDLARLLGLVLMFLTGSLFTPVIGYVIILTLLLSFYLAHTPARFASSHDLTADSVALEIGKLPLWRCLIYDAMALYEWFVSLLFDPLLTVRFGKLVMGKDHVFVLSWAAVRRRPAAVVGAIAPVFTTCSLTRARIISATQVHPKAFAPYGKFVSQMWLELILCLIWVSGGDVIEVTILALCKSAMTAPGSPLTAVALVGAVATALVPQFARVPFGSYNPYGLCLMLSALWVGFDTGFFFGRAESDAVPGKRRSWGFSSVIARVVQVVSLIHLFMFFSAEGSVITALRTSALSISTSALSRVQNIDSDLPWFDLCTFFCVGYSIGAPMGDYSQFAKTKYESMVFTWQGVAVITCLSLVNVIAPFRAIALVPAQSWSLAVILTGPVITFGMLIAARRYASGSLLLRLRASPVGDYAFQMREHLRGLVNNNAFTIETAFTPDLLVDDGGNPVRWDPRVHDDPNLQQFCGYVAVVQLPPGSETYSVQGIVHGVQRADHVFSVADGGKSKRDGFAEREFIRPAINVPVERNDPPSLLGDLGGVLTGSQIRCSLGSLVENPHSLAAGSFGDLGIASVIPTVFVTSNEPSARKMVAAPFALCIWSDNLLAHDRFAEAICNAGPGHLVALRTDVADVAGLTLVYQCGDAADALCRFSVENHFNIPFATGDAVSANHQHRVRIPFARGERCNADRLRQVDMAYAMSNPPHAWSVVTNYGRDDVGYLNASGWNYCIHDANAQPAGRVDLVVRFAVSDTRGTSNLSNYSAWANAPTKTRGDRFERLARIPISAEEAHVFPRFFQRLWVTSLRPAVSYLLTRHSLSESLGFCAAAVICGVTIVDVMLVLLYSMAETFQNTQFASFSSSGPASVGGALLLGLRASPSGRMDTVLSHFGVSPQVTFLLVAAAVGGQFFFPRRLTVSIPGLIIIFFLAFADVTAIATIYGMSVMSALSAAMSLLAVLRLCLFLAAALKAANAVGQLSVSRWDNVFDYVARASWIDSTTGSGTLGVFQAGRCDCNGGGIPYTLSLAKFGLAFDHRRLTFHGRGCHSCRERGGTFYAFDAAGEPILTRRSDFTLNMAYMVEVGNHDDAPENARFSIKMSGAHEIPLTRKFSLLFAMSFFFFCLFGGFAAGDLVFVATVAVITGAILGGIVASYLELRSSAQCYPLLFDTTKEHPSPTDVSELFGAPVNLTMRLGDAEVPPPADYCSAAVRFLFHFAVSVLFADLFVTTIFGKFYVDAGLSSGGLLISSLLTCAYSSEIHVAGVDSVVHLMSRVRLPVVNHVGTCLQAVGKAVHAFADRPSQAAFDVAWSECLRTADLAVATDDYRTPSTHTLGFGSVDFRVAPPAGVMHHKLSDADHLIASSLSGFTGRVPGFDVLLTRRGEYAGGVDGTSLFVDDFAPFNPNTYVTVTGCAMRQRKDELPYLAECVKERVFEKSLKPDGKPCGFAPMDRDLIAAGIFSCALLRSAAGYGNGSNDVSPTEGAEFVASTTNFNLVGSCTTAFGTTNRSALDNPRTWVIIMQIITKFVSEMVALLYPFEFFRKFETRVIDKDDALKTTGVFDRVLPDGTREPCERKRSRIITIVNFATQIFAMLVGPVVKRLIYNPVYGFVNACADGANPNNPSLTLLNAFNRYTRACSNIKCHAHWVSGDIGGWDCKMSVGLLFVSFVASYATVTASGFMLNCVFFTFMFSTYKCAMVGCVTIVFWGQMSSGFFLTSFIDTVGRYILAIGAFIENAASAPLARSRVLLCLATFRRNNPWHQSMDFTRCSVVQLLLILSVSTISGTLTRFTTREDFNPVVVIFNKGDDCVTGMPNVRTDAEVAAREFPDLYELMSGSRTSKVTIKAGMWFTLPYLLSLSAESSYLSRYGMPIHHAESGRQIVACSMTFAPDENGIYHHSTSLEEMFGKLRVYRNMETRIGDSDILSSLRRLDRPQVPFNNPVIFKEVYIQTVQTVLAKNPTSSVMRYLVHRYEDHARRMGLIVDLSSDLQMYINNMWELPVTVTGRTFDEVVQQSQLVPGGVNDWSELAHYGLDRASFSQFVDRLLHVPADVTPDSRPVAAATSSRVLVYGGTGSGKTTFSVGYGSTLARRHDKSMILVVPNPTVGSHVAKTLSGWEVIENMNFYASVTVGADGRSVLHEQGAAFDPGVVGQRVANVVTINAFTSRLVKMGLDSLADYVVMIDEAHIAAERFPIQQYNHVLSGAAGLILVAASCEPTLLSMVDESVHCQHVSTNIKTVRECLTTRATLDKELQRLLAPAELNTYGNVVVIRVVGEHLRKVVLTCLFGSRSRKASVDVVYIVTRGVLQLARPNHKGGYVATNTGLSSIDIASHIGETVAVVMDNSVAEGMNIRMPVGAFGTTIFVALEKQFIYGTNVSGPDGKETTVRSFERRTHYFMSSESDFHQTASRIRGDSHAIKVRFTDLATTPAVSYYPLLPISCPEAFTSALRYMRGVDPGLFYFFVLVTQFAYKSSVSMIKDKVYIARPFLELLLTHASSPDAVEKRLNGAHRMRGGRTSIPAIFEAFSGEAVANLRGPASLVVLPRLPITGVVEDAAWYAAMEMARHDPFNQVLLKDARDKRAPGGPQRFATRVAPAGCERTASGAIRTMKPIFTIAPPADRFTVASVLGRIAEVIVGTGAP